MNKSAVYLFIFSFHSILRIVYFNSEIGYGTLNFVYSSEAAIIFISEAVA